MQYRYGSKADVFFFNTSRSPQNERGRPNNSNRTVSPVYCSSKKQCSQQVELFTFIRRATVITVYIQPNSKHKLYLLIPAFFRSRSSFDPFTACCGCHGYPLDLCLGIRSKVKVFHDGRLKLAQYFFISIHSTTQICVFIHPCEIVCWMKRRTCEKWDCSRWNA